MTKTNAWTTVGSKMIGTPERKWTNNTNTNTKKILNNIFIDKLEIPTYDKYCAILMFQWNQQKSFMDFIKNKFPSNQCFTIIGIITIKIIVNRHLSKLNHVLNSTYLSLSMC